MGRLEPFKLDRNNPKGRVDTRLEPLEFEASVDPVGEAAGLMFSVNN